MEFPQTQNYKMIEFIASGAFADVFKVTKKDQPGSVYALKRVKCKGLDPYHMKLLQSETLLHLQYLPKHPNILRAFDVFNYDMYCCFVMDFCNKTLDHIIKQGKAPTWLKMRFSRQLTSGLDALFEKSIMHRDLKPQNVLISGNSFQDYQIKITDFGLSKRLNPNNFQTFTQVGTPLLMAPQILNSQGFDISVDIWAMGCLLYQLFIGTGPFPAVSMFQLVDKIKKGEYFYPKNADIPFEAICFIDKCIQYQPKNRQYSYNLLQHEFLKTSNEADLHKSEVLKSKDLILSCKKDNFNFLMRGQIDF